MCGGASLGAYGPHPCWLLKPQYRNLGIRALALSPRPTPLWGARSVASRPPASRAS